MLENAWPIASLLSTVFGVSTRWLWHCFFCSEMKISSLFPEHLRSLSPLCRRLCPRTTGHPRQEDPKGALINPSLSYMPFAHPAPQHINRINVSLFTPSLLFSKVAFSLTPGAPLPSYFCLHRSSSHRKIARIMDYPHCVRRHYLSVHGCGIFLRKHSPP